MASLSEYVSLIQSEVDDTSTGASAIITQRVKEIVQEILRQTKQYLQTSTTNDRVLTPGTAEYTPADFNEIVLNYKSDGDFVLLKEITEREYLESHLNDENGAPHSYFLNGLSYHLVPAPSEAGTVRETTQAVPADPNGNSVVPDRFTNVVVLGVTARFKEWENNLNAAQLYQGKYQAALRDMILELSTRNRPVKPRIWGR